MHRLIGQRPLEVVLTRVRAALATEAFDRAEREIADGLRAYPEAEALRELELALRRAQAVQGVRRLKDRIARRNEPRAYEELIALHLDLGLVGEARHEAQAYASAHPDLPEPHVLLGEMHLRAFIEHLQARDAHAAHQRLVRACRLNRVAVRPRALLGQLYWCVGADASLHELAREFVAVAPGDPCAEPFQEWVAKVPEPRQPDCLDGAFARVEVEGALRRPAEAWFTAGRRTMPAAVDEERAQRAARSLVTHGAAAEVVLLQRGGTLLAHEQADPEADDPPAVGEGLVDVARTVARTVSSYVHDLDLGAFRRCTIAGPFGLVTVGDVAGLVAGARWRSNPEPERLWERVAVGLEDQLGGPRT